MSDLQPVNILGRGDEYGLRNNSEKPYSTVIKRYSMNGQVELVYNNKILYCDNRMFVHRKYLFDFHPESIGYHDYIYVFVPLSSQQSEGVHKCNIVGLNELSGHCIVHIVLPDRIRSLIQSQGCSDTSMVQDRSCVQYSIPLHRIRHVDSLLTTDYISWDFLS